ncbi:MAG: 30S ribosome-binding factor RbfA [Bdellovibrio sp.]|nr:30S ribosome-binding factor RbfA [Bdellovibrio sp.]
MKNAGDNNRRKERVEREVQQIISSYLIQNLQTELNGLVTVSRVQMPLDFRTAKVYTTFFSQDGENPKYIDELKRWAPDIQREIDNKLKMRYCPKLTFLEDESTEDILKIERIIAEISKKNASSATGSDSDDSSESED